MVCVCLINSAIHRKPIGTPLEPQASGHPLPDSMRINLLQSELYSLVTELSESHRVTSCIKYLTRDVRCSQRDNPWAVASRWCEIHAGCSCQIMDWRNYAAAIHCERINLWCCCPIGTRFSDKKPSTGSNKCLPQARSAIYIYSVTMAGVTYSISDILTKMNPRVCYHSPTTRWIDHLECEVGF